MTPWLDRTSRVEHWRIVGTLSLLLGYVTWLPDAASGLCWLIALTLLVLRPAWLWMARKFGRSRPRATPSITVTLSADTSEFAAGLRRIADLLTALGDKPGLDSTEPASGSRDGAT